MRTAITGLLALAATTAAIMTIDTTTTHAQALDPASLLEQASSEQAPPPVPAEPQPEAIDQPQEIALGTFTTSAYSLRGYMRSGAWTYYGAIAVDPDVIPLGSTVYIEDLGYFTAEDTGGAVWGSHIDIWLPSYWEAIGYGLQYRRAWLIS